MKKDAKPATAGEKNTVTVSLSLGECRARLAGIEEIFKNASVSWSVDLGLRIRRLAKILKSLVEDSNELYDSEVNSLAKRRRDLANDLAMKDEKGTFIIIDDRYTFDTPAKNSEYLSKETDILRDHEKFSEDFTAKMKTPVPVTLIPIPKDWLPKELPGPILTAILEFVEEEAE